MQAHAKEVSDAHERIGARLKELVKKRYMEECETVASLAQLVKEAVHDEHTLPHDLRIIDNKLVVDSSSIFIPSPQKRRPLPPKEVRYPRAE